MPTRPKSAQKGVAGRRPRSGKTSLPRVAGACAGSPAQSSYVQPSDVRIEAVEGLRDQVSQVGASSAALPSASSLLGLAASRATK